jgi:tRNA threonylcarbamoyladenosine biosynthesis protein TsaB
MSAATVLGLDTSTAHATVALTRGAEVLREEGEGPDDAGRPRHAELLMEAVEACADAAGGWEGVGSIAIGLGPGSFTGLRIGIATARALAQARELPIAGVSTLAALARGIGEHPEAGGRPRLPVSDARRGQAFAGIYGADGVEARGPFLADPGELAEATASHEPRPLAAGEGSVRFRAELEAAGAVVPPDGDPVHRVAARHICALAAAAEQSAPERIEPIYLRAPDAKIWLERDRDEPPR